MTRQYVPLETRLEQIKRLRNEGRTRAEIGEELSLSRKQVATLIRKAKDHGVIPDTAVHYKSRGVRIGSLEKSSRAMPDEAAKWVFANLPQGTTLAEFAVACMVDQYHEEAGQ